MNLSDVDFSTDGGALITKPSAETAEITNASIDEFNVATASQPDHFVAPIEETDDSEDDQSIFNSSAGNQSARSSINSLLSYPFPERVPVSQRLRLYIFLRTLRY